jgi:acetyltransferase-like isoleucine patch superfamily enzyme
MHLGALRPAVIRMSMTAGPIVRDRAKRARRAAFIAQVKTAALMAPADLDLCIAPDADIGLGVRVSFDPHTSNRIHIGPGCRVERDVEFILRGGSIELGPQVTIRPGTVVKASGRLVMEGHTPISWRCVIHCAEEVVLQHNASVAEGVTISDSSHFFTTPDQHLWHNVRTAPVNIGRNTWLCPKSTVAKGVTIGNHCIVASNSVVISDVPDGSMASGVPATYRPLALPWLS